jgi:hypothetical protein
VRRPPVDIELNQLVKTGYIPGERGGEGRTAAGDERYYLRRRAGRDRIEMQVPADVLDDETVARRYSGKEELEYRPRYPRQGGLVRYASRVVEIPDLGGPGGGECPVDRAKPALRGPRARQTRPRRAARPRDFSGAYYRS